jgi:hypothetical protein
MVCYLWLFWFGFNLGLGGVRENAALLLIIGATKRVVLAQKENFLDISVVSREDLGSGLGGHSGAMARAGAWRVTVSSEAGVKMPVDIPIS